MKKSAIIKTSKVKNNNIKSLAMKLSWQIYRSEGNTLNWSESLKFGWLKAKDHHNNYSFDILYKTHFNKIYNSILYKCNFDQDLAITIVNDTFIRATDNINSYDPSINKIETWLYRIANNLFLNEIKKRNKSRLTHISDYQDENGKEYFQLESDIETDNSNNNHINVEILKALDSIKNPLHKDIIVMRFIEQLDNEEIAQRLDISHQLVRTTISRQRTVLQKSLAHLVA